MQHAAVILGVAHCACCMERHTVCNHHTFTRYDIQWPSWYVLAHISRSLLTDGKHDKASAMIMRCGSQSCRVTGDVSSGSEQNHLKILNLVQHISKVGIQLSCTVSVVVHAAHFTSTALKGKLKIRQDVFQGCTQPLALKAHHKADLRQHKGSVCHTRQAWEHGQLSVVNTECNVLLSSRCT